MGQSNLPYTDPWVVLGVHKGASREEIKAAFRRAALSCHPDVDSSPSAGARFADIKAAADVLLKGPQGRPYPGTAAAAAAAAGAWDPAAAAAAAAQQGRGGGVPHNRTAALWAGLCLMCSLAFGYGWYWADYARKRSRLYASPQQGEGQRLRTPSPQRRKLLQTLLEDQRAQHHKQQQQQQVQAAEAAPPDAAGASVSGDGG